MKSKVKKVFEKFIVAIVMMVLNLVGKPLDLKKSSGNSRTGKTNSRASNKPQVHRGLKETIMVRGSQNSFQLFAMTVFNVGPPELIFNKTEVIPKRSDRMQFFFRPDMFVMIAIPQIAGQQKNSPNKDLVLEHKVIPVLNWKGKSPSQKIDDTKMKKTKLTSNLDFPLPWPSIFPALTAVGTNIETADNKLQERLQNLPHSKKNLSDAVNLLKDNMDDWCMMVKLKVKTVSPEEGVRICNDAGFNHKIISIRPKRKNTVNQGTEPGSLIIYGEGKGFRQWQESTDPNQETFTDIAPTRGGKLIVTGRLSKREYWYRWRLVLTKDRYGEWSPWYSGFAP